ncbi:hypothetical protein [Caulobacter sp. S45]|uniref:hypothetical protein n=1 Tax=Caulobacter sp. S45 TaxID=1641861 RepID=UPI001576E847|nr:hypothetical protein [Caulobacter sp. S45]
MAAALEHPGALLRRAVGSTDPFQLEPASLPNVPDAPQRPAVKAAGQTRRAPAPKPPPDRTELDAAELALRSLDEARKSEEADLRQRQDDLDASRRSAQKAYVEAHKTAKAAIARAEELYRKAGGEV